MKKKKQDPMLNELPAVAADYIKLIIRKMRYRRKVQAEVKEELADHFREALDDYRSDEQREKKARRLIEQFGDAKMLGILLRRAKKRCRPLWRTITLRTFQTAGVLIIAFILYFVWFLSGKPVVTRDYVAELNELVRPVANESLNAALFYNEAAQLLDKPKDEVAKLLSKRYHETTAEQRELIGLWLEENNRPIELIVAGAQRPYYWPTYKSDSENSMTGVLMPHLAMFREGTHALSWRAMLSAEQGRYEDAFDDIKTCYRFGHHLKGDTVLIEQLTGMAVKTLAVRSLRSILAEHAIEGDLLAHLQEDMEQIVAEDDWIVSLEAEKLFMYDEIQRCFTESRFGPSHLYLKRLLALGEPLGFEYSKDPLDLLIFAILLSPDRWVNTWTILFAHPDKQEAIQAANRYYALWDEIVAKTPAELAAEGIDPEQRSAEIIKDNLLLTILGPENMARMHTVVYQHKVYVESGLIVLAVLRYEQDTGRLPETLEQLKAAGYVEKIPIDPFSGKFLAYRKTEKGFVLYSFGRDLDDDLGQGPCYKTSETGGRVDKGDWVFWPVEVE